MNENYIKLFLKAGIPKHILWLNLVFVCYLLAASPAFAQNPNDGFYPSFGFGFAHSTRTIAVRPDGKMYVGGQFLNLGGNSNRSLALLNSDGTGVAGFAGNVEYYFVIGAVNVIVIQSDGKIIIGGFFSQVNGTPRSNIARLDPETGNVDPTFAPVVDGEVYSIEILPDQSIVVGGDFTSVNSTARNYLAKLTPGGILDSSFNPNPSAVVKAIKLDKNPNKIYAAGDFTTIGGQSRPYAVRLFTNGTTDRSFNPPVPDSSNAISIQADGKVVIGHSTGVRRYHITGTADPTLQIGTTDPVHAVAFQADGKIIIGGAFSTINGVPRNKVARLNLNGTLDVDFDPNVTGSIVGTITVQPDYKILLGGVFSMIGGVNRQTHIGRVYPDGRLDDHATAGANSVVSAIAPLTRRNRTLLGGDFTTFDGINSSRLVRVLSNGKRDPTFNNPQITGGWVYSITAYDDWDQYLIGGSFTSVNANPNRKYLTRLFTDGSTDTTFAPTLNNFVQTTAVQLNLKILIGGGFTNVNGFARSYIARLNSDGTVDTTFNPSFDFWVNKILLQQDGKIIVIGSFSTVNGSPRVGIVRLTSSGAVDTTFNVTFTGLGEIAEALFQPDGKILIGGGFTSVNGVARTNIARLNANGTLDTSFNASADSSPLSMAVQADGKIVIGGRFNTINGTTRNGVARLNTDGTLDSTFVSNTDDVVLALAQQNDGKVLVGGYFSQINGVSRSRFARLSNETAAVENLAISPTSIEWSRSGSAPAFTRVEFYSSSSTNGGYLGSGTRDPVTGKWRLNNVLTNGETIFAFGYHGDYSHRRGIVEIAQWSPYVASSNTPFDFDGDGKTDISIFRPSLGQWWYLRSFDLSSRAFAFGTSTDKPVPEDYTGDGKTDMAFWRASTGEWFVLRSENLTFYSVPFGTAGDIPAPGDFDGDGKADTAIYRPSTSTWWIQNSSGGTTVQGFGLPDDKPVVGDYDGDGRDDIAIYRPSSSQWWQFRSQEGVVAYQFGTAGDKTVQGDYTGDGRADVALFRPSDRHWYVLRSENSSFYAVPFGLATDIPTPGDYDGDGKFDTAVFRPSNSTWYVDGSANGFFQVGFGQTGDLPLPNSYVRN